jgi:hypothetical protein
MTTGFTESPFFLKAIVPVNPQPSGSVQGSLLAGDCTVGRAHIDAVLVMLTS